MTKKLFTLFTLCLLTTIAAWGETWTYYLTRADFGTNELTAILNEKSWTADSIPAINWSNERGRQFGSSNSPISDFQLSSSAFSGTISSITVNASGSTGIEGNINVKVGGTPYSSNSTALTTSATDYTFTGVSDGTIVIQLTQTSRKAFYIHPHFFIKKLYIK